MQFLSSPNNTQNGATENVPYGGHLVQKKTENSQTATGNSADPRTSRRSGRMVQVHTPATTIENNKNNNSVRNENNKEAKSGQNSLAGERVHGLPSNTNSREDSNQPSTINISEILANIDELNKEQVIRNEDVFGPVTNETVIIVIQVHNRITYLRHLIVSLSTARDIDKTLLIFSHDFWDEDINKLVRSIDFSQVLQIFYPFSLQTHPHSFPGESRRDCPRDAKPDQAQRMKCINKDWPDLYGHYREAKFSQTKHHWWWKTNQVFDKLDVTSNFNGNVLFLEEDHYVSEDFLHVLSLMEKERINSSQHVDILCLGTYLKKFNYQRESKTAEVTQWVSSKHNMGMTLNREQWKKIASCSPQFCQYDDYNWDWSLQHVSLNCLKDKLQVMLIKGPRVFHIGECGVHHKKSDCESRASQVIEKVKGILKSATEYLFPERIALVTATSKKKIKLKKGNGGWGDKRDHALCLNMTRRG